jgi:hypothetical protein
MKRLMILLLLAATTAPLAGCVAYPAQPGPPYGGAHWVPGYHGPYGGWHPGHWQ